MYIALMVILLASGDIVTDTKLMDKETCEKTTAKVIDMAQGDKTVIAYQVECVEVKPNPTINKGRSV